MALSRRARGIGDHGAIRRFATMAFALLVLAIRRGSKLATAMEARGLRLRHPAHVGARVPGRRARCRAPRDRRRDRGDRHRRRRVGGHVPPGVGVMRDAPTPRTAIARPPLAARRRRARSCSRLPAASVDRSCSIDGPSGAGKSTLADARRAAWPRRTARARAPRRRLPGLVGARAGGQRLSHARSSLAMRAERSAVASMGLGRGSCRSIEWLRPGRAAHRRGLRRVRGDGAVSRCGEGLGRRRRRRAQAPRPRARRRCARPVLGPVGAPVAPVRAPRPRPRAGPTCACGRRWRDTAHATRRDLPGALCHVVTRGLR